MSILIEELKSSEPSVVCAAIEALEATEPETLKANIVPLLLNNNVWVRSRAARAMCHWDRTEAIRYLAVMLFSKNIAEREAAINHSLFFPFKEIEAVLLKYLTVENNPELIKKAGLVFMANPDKMTAFRLYEAQQATRNLRSDLINGILMGVLNSLYQAKLEKDVPFTLLKQIEVEYKKRKLKIYINHFSELLSSEDSEIRYKASLKLCELQKNNIADVSEIISNYLKNETDENVSKKLKEYIEATSIKVDTGEIKDAKTLENRKKIYATLNKDNYSKYISILLPEIDSFDYSEQITLIHFIEEYGGKSEVNYVLNFLKSQDNDVKQAAIDCVSKINQEALMPYLPQLIKSDSDQIKLAGLKAFSLVDKAQALALLTDMIGSVKVTQRRNAIFCLANLDFASVSDILTAALKHEKDRLIRKEILTILLDNVNEEVFYELYFQYKAANQVERAELKSFLNKYSDKLAFLQNCDKSSDDFWIMAKNRWKEENANIEQREAYRLEKIQSLIKLDDRKEKIELVKFTIICHGIGLILTFLIWFGFMSPNAWFNKVIDDDISENNNNELEFSINQTKEEIPLEPISISGIITESNSEHKQAILVDKLGKKYLLSFKESGIVPKSGKDFSAQVMVEDYENSVFTAEVLTVY